MEIPGLQLEKTYEGEITSVDRRAHNLIVVTVKIGDESYTHHVWGCFRFTSCYTEDQYEDYLELAERVVKNKFFREFNVDLENSKRLIGHKCYCEKRIFNNKQFLKILKVA